jgi:ribosomal protein S27E
MYSYVNSNFSGVKDMSSRNWEYFFQHYGLKRKCENCGMLLSRNSPVNKAHIIKRSFFKSRGTKLYKDIGFEHHMANTLILCANCHDKIDRKGMHPSKRLLNRRTKLKDRMLNDIKEDIRFIREMMKEINMFRFELESYKIELEKELRQKMAERIKEWLNTFT